MNKPRLDREGSFGCLHLGSMLRKDGRWVMMCVHSINSSQFRLVFEVLSFSHEWLESRVKWWLWRPSGSWTRDDDGQPLNKDPYLSMYRLGDSGPTSIMHMDLRNSHRGRFLSPPCLPLTQPLWICPSSTPMCFLLSPPTVQRIYRNVKRYYTSKFNPFTRPIITLTFMAV